MKRTALVLKIYIVLSILVSLTFLGLKAPGFYYMFKVKQVIAEGGFPSQYGIIAAQPTLCACSPSPQTCTSCVGGLTCSAVMAPSAATCPMYDDVTGSMAGGNGASVLLLLTSMIEMGLTKGGQLICGGTTESMLAICGSTGGISMKPN